MSIYQIAQGSALVGPVELPPVPGAGQLLPEGFIELPAPLSKPNAGKAWAWDGEKAVQLQDQRGTYYRTEDGARVDHHDLGPLPDGLTSQPRPGPEYVWTVGGWEYSATLAAEIRQNLSASLCTKIDQAADAARRAVAGDPLRAVEYDRAASEAQAFAASGYQGEVPPMVAAWAISGRTPQQAADSILAEAAQYNGALVQLRTVRLQAKELIRAAINAGNIEQAQDIAAETIASIEAAVAGIGNNAS